MNALFHHDTFVAPLASGSRGNCTYIGDGQRGVLVDCGISTKQVLARLDEVGLGDSQIDAVLLTHEHTDHVASCRVLDKRLFAQQGRRVPFYATGGTMLGMDDRCRPKKLVEIRSGSPFQVAAGWTVEPFTIPHDTRDPVAYTIQIADVRVGVVTDLGRSTRLVEQHFASLDVAVLEFNHDVQMLMEGEYPWRLKQRVRGPHGHISNAQAAELVQRAATRRLKHLVLGHLSQDNNTPARAVEAAQQGLHGSQADNACVWVADQRKPLAPLRVRSAKTFPTVAPKPSRPRTSSVAPNLPNPDQQSLF